MSELQDLLKEAYEVTKDDVLNDAYDAMKNSIEKAEDSTVPYAVTTDESVKIVGDANNTDSIKSDYTVSFLIPKELVPDLEAPTIGSNKYIVKEYKNVELTVKKNVAISSYMADIIPYFYKPVQDGEVVNYQPEEEIEIRKNFADEHFLSSLRMINMILFDIKEDMAQYITYKTLLHNTVQFFEEHPELINEAFSFFV